MNNMDSKFSNSLFVNCNDKHEARIYESGIGVTLFTYMKKYSNRILQFIAETGETDTYEQVLNKSIRTALKLKVKGIGKNDIIGTCSHNQKNSYIPSFAALFLGAIPVNFEPNLSHLDTTHLLKLLQLKIIFVSEESLPFIENCLTESKTESEIVVLGHNKEYPQFAEYLKHHPQEGDFQPSPVEDSKETAIIMFSSGTTGLPKGICLNHSSLIGVLNKNNHIGNTEKKQSINIWFTTLYWISAVKMMINTITNGDAQVVCSKFDPREVWRVIEKYKINCLMLATHLGYEFLRHRPKNVDTSSLKLVITGGAAHTKALIEGYRSALPNISVTFIYAQTEPAGIICFFDPDKPEDVQALFKKPLSCGKVRQGIMWKVVDLDNGRTLGPNQRGEMRIKCDTIMNGYYKTDSSTAFDSDGYFKTGDIVFYDDDECFYVVGRVKEIFKYQGWHILPEVLEGVLLAHPAVKEAAVIGIPHDIDGEHPMGIVVLHEEDRYVTPMEIETFVEERVPETQKLRAGIRVVKELLRTATGKIRRNVLQKMVLDEKL